MKGNMGKHNAKEDGVILGHEFCGTVSQVGEDVSGYKVFKLLYFYVISLSFIKKLQS